VLWVKVRNRGRRVTHIETVSRVVSAWRAKHELSAGMHLKRWYVIDGGGRTFPLRERYRRRVESVIFWPTRA
jgi:hypothetical protein